MVVLYILTTVWIRSVRQSVRLSNMLRIDVHHYIHQENEQAVNSKLDRILAMVNKINAEEDAEMVDLAALKAQTAATKEVIDSTKLVIDSAISTFNEILGKLENVVDPAEVAALVEEGKAYTAALTAERDALAAAVAEFTPPPPPPGP